MKVEAQANMVGEAEVEDLAVPLKAGAPWAWDRLYRLTRLPLLRFLMRRLRDSMRAEEALQETYLAAIAGIASFDSSRGSPDSWLCGIARNKARESFRARAAAPLGDDPEDRSADPAEARDEAEAVGRALDEIEPRYAEVLRRKFIAGETLEAISDALGLKVATVGTLVHRGKDRFRAAYERLSTRARQT